MSQIQSCAVCGRQAVLVKGTIQVRAGDPGEPLLVGQCPRCHRFVCTRHGESLELPRRRWRLLRGRGLLTVCCPFDPDVPLGGEETAEGFGSSR